MSPQVTVILLSPESPSSPTYEFGLLASKMKLKVENKERIYKAQIVSLIMNCHKWRMIFKLFLSCQRIIPARCTTFTGPYKF